MRINYILNIIKHFFYFINVLIQNIFGIVPKKTIRFNTRNQMLKFYCEQFADPKVLEIGVFKGDFLHFLNTNCKTSSIDAVDLFEGYASSGDADGKNVVFYNLEKAYLELLNKYQGVEKIKIYKSNSTTFLNNKEDNTYDIIYIDADHSYEAVKNDLKYAFNTIKDGGYIMGHDYAINLKKANSIYKFEVKKAVDEFCQIYEQKIVSFALDGYISFCIKINKNQFSKV